MPLKNLPVDDLADRCAKETNDFHQGRKIDPQYCFELLRRALADEVSAAFTHVYHIYEPQVRRWVARHNAFASTNENADYFANLALTNFYFALRGEKFHQFPSLAKVLSYLKLCVHTAVVQYLRQLLPNEPVAIDDERSMRASTSLNPSIEAIELWEHICRLLRDDDDRFLARCVFLQAMKPAEISAEFPERWSTARQVSVALQRIRRALRNNADLRQWIGESPN